MKPSISVGWFLVDHPDSGRAIAILYGRSFVEVYAPGPHQYKIEFHEMRCLRRVRAAHRVSVTQTTFCEVFLKVHMWKGESSGRRGGGGRVMARPQKRERANRGSRRGPPHRFGRVCAKVKGKADQNRAGSITNRMQSMCEMRRRGIMEACTAKSKVSRARRHPDEPPHFHPGGLFRRPALLSKNRATHFISVRG